MPMRAMIDGGGPSTDGFGSGTITADPMAQVSFDTPNVQTYSPQTGYTPPTGTQYSPGPSNPGGGGATTMPNYIGGMNMPGYVTGGANQSPMTPPPPPPVHHSFQEFLDNGQAATDPTYVAQKSALVGKLNDYERNVGNQIGSQNLSQVSNPGDLLGSYWKGNSLGDLYKENKDVNGDSDFVSTGALNGGSLGKGYDTALANFNNQQSHGLRNVAEDFASRGMLGSGSGVWQTARNNAQDQYRQQLGNINDSTVGQYNSLLGNLADQYSQGRNSLTGYLTDASNRMATAMNSGLPTSV